MVFETSGDEPDEIVEKVERSHEFALNQLGEDTEDVLVMATPTPAGWSVRMAIEPGIGTADE